ncbi:killer toxin sensitivity protein [Sporothrix brasiliensis 5110]|uniref:Elongator complex protein 5 n=1 Tax=Sporothrix brasiliensis 5110 TaxID=1398154 RepID=A0A0C2J1A2_9PEZI|nr:killer toxin sensitivity protein [Sporothrix brasiliensis 5110]KIH95116.1 killer toxin sensitivity protein [Sporothrix brasiliensis 5110]
MATPRAHAHSRSSYSVLLLQKLLSLRDGVSPLTLVLDTVRESGVPLVEEMMLRAKTGAAAKTDKTAIVYVASHLAPRRRSPHVDVFVERRGQPLDVFREAILAAVSAVSAAGPKKVLVVVDSLCHIARQDPLRAAAFVSSLVSPAASVVGLYHTDGVGASSTMSGPSPLHRGKPHPFRILCHLATAVLRVRPLHEEVARKRARDRAEEVPRFGWAEGEGWPYGYSDAALRYGTRRDLVGGTPEALDRRGLLVTMELRRRSGRAVVEQYVVVLGTEKTAAAPATRPASATAPRSTPAPAPAQIAFPWQPGAVPCANITVMADHPLFAAARDPREDDRQDDVRGDEDAPTSTFNLGLTDKQRRDREGIVLPYFDAQTDIGAGEGGRILYDMGREDDFDDEEDEI